jgi:hypothetical protein
MTDSKVLGWRKAKIIRKKASFFVSKNAHFCDQKCQPDRDLSLATELLVRGGFQTTRGRANAGDCSLVGERKPRLRLTVQPDSDCSNCDAS